jgi:hypothetical protein
MAISRAKFYSIGMWLNFSNCDGPDILSDSSWWTSHEGRTLFDIARRSFSAADLAIFSEEEEKQSTG